MSEDSVSRPCLWGGPLKGSANARGVARVRKITTPHTNRSAYIHTCIFNTCVARMPEPPPLGGEGRASLRQDKVLSLIPRLFTDDLTGKIAVNRGRWLSGRGLIGQALSRTCARLVVP